MNHVPGSAVQETHTREYIFQPIVKRTWRREHRGYLLRQNLLFSHTDLKKSTPAEQPDSTEAFLSRNLVCSKSEKKPLLVRLWTAILQPRGLREAGQLLRQCHGRFQGSSRGPAALPANIEPARAQSVTHTHEPASALFS